uniref:Uncharacterized protein n=1 Tax=Aegilops tauschii subsp. strangulata TaxID=200361 RepID=A0A452ZBN3_AEGTS
PANSSHEHQQQQREANRPAGEMAQESLRLVCPPVSAHEGRLPRQYTLEGQGAKKDISPPLEWYGVPDGTRSLAVVVQDVDADERVPWTHRVARPRPGLPRPPHPVPALRARRRAQPRQQGKCTYKLQS